MIIRHLVAIFAIFVAMMFHTTGFSQEKDDCVTTVCLLKKNDFNDDEIHTILEIKKKKFPIVIYIISKNGKSKIDILPNGEILLYALNDEGEYVLFASIS